LFEQKQKPVSSFKYSWLLPYRSIFGADELIELAIKIDLKPKSYSQAGGDLSIIYQDTKL